MIFPANSEWNMNPFSNEVKLAWKTFQRHNGNVKEKPQSKTENTFLFINAPLFLKSTTDKNAEIQRNSRRRLCPNVKLSWAWFECKRNHENVRN